MQFIETDEVPTIKQMFVPLLMGEEWGAWLNCDIVLTAPFREAMQEMQMRGYKAATSQRYEYDPVDYPDLSKAVVPPNDLGLDIFVTTPDIWKAIWQLIHPDLRKTGMMYDTWITGYLWKTFGFGYRSFTNFRCVFHPKHGERRYDLMNKQDWVEDEYGKSARIPPPLERSQSHNRQMAHR